MEVQEEIQGSKVEMIADRGYFSNLKVFDNSTENGELTHGIRG